MEKSEAIAASYNEFLLRSKQEDHAWRGSITGSAAGAVAEEERCEGQVLRGFISYSYQEIRAGRRGERRCSVGRDSRVQASAERPKVKRKAEIEASTRNLELQQNPY